MRKFIKWFLILFWPGIIISTCSALFGIELSDKAGTNIVIISLVISIPSYYFYNYQKKSLHEKSGIEVANINSNAFEQSGSYLVCPSCGRDENQGNNFTTKEKRSGGWSGAALGSMVAGWKGYFIGGALTQDIDLVIKCSSCKHKYTVSKGDIYIRRYT